ncbi:MAG: hypothetical protein AAGC97_07375 [Planctomycetota bacterium]
MSLPISPDVAIQAASLAANAIKQSVQTVAGAAAKAGASFAETLAESGEPSAAPVDGNERTELIDGDALGEQVRRFLQSRGIDASGPLELRLRRGDRVELAQDHTVAAQIEAAIDSDSSIRTQLTQWLFTQPDQRAKLPGTATNSGLP